MRLPDDSRPKAIVLGLSLVIALGGCGMLGRGGSSSLPAAPREALGPQADYPMVTGEAYQVGAVTYTPEDVMNYDEVGRLAGDPQGGGGITASHHTLPLPSYVEVTSLETGRTILARVERRGPMDGNQLIALSPGGLQELVSSPGTAVRVRRVNPPEEQRALLRAGQAAPLRMDTPMSLVAVLRRRLPDAAMAAPSAPATAQTIASAPSPASASTAPAPTDTPASAAGAPANRASVPPLPPLESGSDSQVATISPRAASPAQAPRQAPRQAIAHGFVVQAAAFSSADRAKGVAEQLKGTVSPVGRLFRVRTGPFATRQQAEASLAKVKAAGYKDARIFTSG